MRYDDCRRSDDIVAEFTTLFSGTPPADTGLAALQAFERPQRRLAPAQQVSPQLPAGHPHRDERNDRDDARDDAIARLVDDRLDIRC